MRPTSDKDFLCQMPKQPPVIIVQGYLMLFQVSIFRGYHISTRLKKIEMLIVVIN